MKKIILSLMTLMVLVMVVGSVSAVHTSDVTVTTDNWLEANTLTDFTVEVLNNGADSINRVVIYVPSEYSDLDCGSAPTDWTLTETFSYCRYDTVTDTIGLGGSEEFTLQATTSSDVEDTWLVTSVDTATNTDDNFVTPEGWTIQDAINSASPGDTINVPAGTYEESILINKPLTLIGNGKPIITGDDSTHNYIVKITADNVVFDNFEVNGDGSETGDNAFDYGIWINDTENVEVTNSIVKNIWKGSSNGIQVDDSSSSEIHDNLISSFQKRGIRYLNSDGEFYDNEVIGDNVDGTERVQNLVNVDDGSDVEIYNNELHNALTTTGVTPTWDSPCIFVSSYAWDGSEADSYANIHNNEIYDCDSGIVIGSVYSTIDGSTADITGNNIHDTADAIVFEVERITGGNNEVSAIIHENIFTDNEMNINVIGTTTTTTIDATNNWWGTSIGEDIQNLISGDVDYDPWWYDETGSADTTDPTIEFNNAPYFTDTLTVTIDATITDDRDIEKYVLEFGDNESVEVNVTGDHDLTENVLESHTYPGNGDYFVTITVYDATGNYVIEETSVSIDDNEYDWRIPLNTGWNLISFPMIPTDENHEVDQTVENAIINKIYDSLPGGTEYVIMQYDAITGNWKKSRRSGYGNLDNIVPGYAYWINVNQDTVLKGYGRETDEWGMPPSVELGNSWNLIGKFGDEPVQKNLSAVNLIFDDGFRNLGDFPIMHNGEFIDEGEDLIHYEGYWALLPGNNGNPVTYTVSDMDYL